MAKAPATTAPEATAFDLASFSLEADLSVEIPKDVPRGGPKHTDLPFKASFTANLGIALDGKQPHFYVPDAFWLARKPDAKVNASYGRGKIRDQFNKWVAEDEKVRSVLDLTLIYRPDGIKDADGKTVKAGPGLSYWIVKKAA